MVLLTGIRHVFFDLDDTIWDHEGNSRNTLGQIFTELGLEKRLGVPFQPFFEAYRQENLRLWSLYYKRQINKDQLRGDRFKNVLAEYKIHDNGLAERITELFAAKGPSGKLLKQGSLEVLDYLKDKYHLHILSNGFSEIQKIKLDGCDLRKYFETVIISDEHQMLKPEVEFFRLAENLTGARAEECVLIGDSVESDITGARNAGWQSVHLSDEPSDEVQGLHIRSLTQLLNFL